MEIEIQTEDRPYSCPQCDLPQLQPVRLLNHQCFQTEKTHALVHRSQSCLAVRFPEARNRKGTEGGPVHSGEKPVVHTQCNFSCTTACHLKIHNQIHLGEMSFNCRQCNYACTTAVNLKRHMLTHERAKHFGCSSVPSTECCHICALYTGVLGEGVFLVPSYQLLVFRSTIDCIAL